jgi:ribosomal protein S16
MIMIRLARFGAKKKPFYRVVVIEKERARNGAWSRRTPRLPPRLPERCPPQCNCKEQNG